MSPTQKPPTLPRTRPTRPYPTARIVFCPPCDQGHAQGLVRRTGCRRAVEHQPGRRKISAVGVPEVDRAALADGVVGLAEPLARRRAAEILQLLEEAPLGVEARGGGVLVELPAAVDAVHVDALVLVLRKLALVDEPADEIDGAQLAQQRAVEADLGETVLDLMRGARRLPPLDRVDLDQHDVVRASLVEQREQRRVAGVAAVPIGLAADLDRL